MLCTVTSTLVPPSTEITRRTITFPVSSPICSPEHDSLLSLFEPVSDRSVAAEGSTNAQGTRPRSPHAPSSSRSISDSQYAHAYATVKTIVER